MQEEVIESKDGRYCAACQSDDGKERGRKNGFYVISCRNCGTLYTSRADAAAGAHDYNEYYDQENLSVPDFINKRLDEIVSAFKPYRRTGRLLDVGFGAGSLIEAAGRAGWAVSGVEVSEPAVEHVRGLGFDVFCGELADAKYPEGHFDVVTASEVIEHVTEPHALLEEMARVLRPGGLLWATTPHGRGLSFKLLGVKWSVVSPPEHLQLFSLRSIKALLKEVGFRKVRVMTHGTNPSEILSVWRSRGEVSSASGGCQRVEAAYQLNEFMTQSPTRRAVKTAINGLLNISRLGDSLKIWAEK